MGIVTGYKKTTSANALADPAGKIEENSWGFRTWKDNYVKPTCWRYNYDGSYEWIYDMRIPKSI